MHRSSVLLVNDDAVVNMVHAAIVGSEGVDVSDAVDGEPAVLSCTQDPPDAVIMDMDMPVMDGIQAAEGLQQAYRDGSLPYVAVVFSSALMSEQRRQSCMAAGALDFREKPATHDRLVGASRAALEATRRVRERAEQ